MHCLPPIIDLIVDEAGGAEKIVVDEPATWPPGVEAAKNPAAAKRVEECEVLVGA